MFRKFFGCGAKCNTSKTNANAAQPSGDPFIRFIDDVIIPSPPPAPKTATATATPTAPPKKRRGLSVTYLSFLAVFGTGAYVHKHGHLPFVSPDAQTEETREFSVDSPQHFLIKAETFNGEVRVERGLSDKVNVRVVRRATGASQEQAFTYLPFIEVKYDQSDTSIQVVAQPIAEAKVDGRDIQSQLSADIVVTVPEGTRAQLKNKNGQIVVENVQGPVKADTVNGSITVQGATGDLNLESKNGSIRCAATDAVIQCVTVNGQISFEGTLDTGDSSLETRNGSINVELPEDFSFAVDARSAHGRVKSEFRKLRSKKQTLVGKTCDDPTVTLKLRTANGNIELERD